MSTDEQKRALFLRRVREDKQRIGVLFALIAAFAAAAIVLCLAAGVDASPKDAAVCSGACAVRVNARLAEQRWQRTWRAAPPAVRSHLRRIAWCESRNDERAVSAGGTYRGLLQFDHQTWRSVGGRGDPAAASRWEQWARGVLLYRQRGAQPWPVCQHR